MYYTDTVEVTLYNHLPDSEYRLLKAVGEEHSEISGKLPIIYRIARSVADPVLKRLAGIGIQWHQPNTKGVSA